jgi:predicted HAD superfamily Cof-like phosphohydrolase
MPRIITIEGMLMEFHETYGVEISDKPVDLETMDYGLFRLRNNLHREEWRELEEAFDSGSIVDVTDAICDLVYVLVGTCVSLGIPFERAFTEVHRSNMSKLGEDGKPIYREEDGKVLKGPNWSPPDLADVLYGG